MDDTKFIIELVNSPGWLQYIGNRNIATEDQAKAYLQNGPLKSYQEHGFGLYLVALKNDGTPVGMCGILKRDYLEDPDIGFAFLPAFTGKGMALEIAGATLSYANHALKLSPVCAITVPGNKRSIRLLEKLGFRFVKTLNAPADTQKLMLFRS